MEACLKLAKAELADEAAANAMNLRENAGESSVLREAATRRTIVDEYVITKQGIEEAAAAYHDEVCPRHADACGPFQRRLAEVFLSHCKVRPSSLLSSDPE